VFIEISSNWAVPLNESPQIHTSRRAIVEKHREHTPPTKLYSSASGRQTVGLEDQYDKDSYSLKSKSSI